MPKGEKTKKELQEEISELRKALNKGGLSAEDRDTIFKRLQAIEDKLPDAKKPDAPEEKPKEKEEPKAVNYFDAEEEYGI